MSMSGYTKLFSTILASTIWREAKETKILWITMLAMADRNGLVEGSIPGLADMARLTVDETLRALEDLFSPDKFSRSKEHDGRRIESVDGGWRVLNHGKYREKMNADDRREYLRLKQQEWRDRRKQKINNRGESSTPSTHAEADAEAVSLTLARRKRPTLEEAKSAANQTGVTVEQAESWWHARESSDWMKGTAGGGSLPVGDNWRSDMKSFTNNKLERERSNANKRSGTHRTDDLNKPGRYK